MDREKPYVRLAPHAKFSQPSTQEALDVVGQMTECGVLSVRLTGGEALVRRDFLLSSCSSSSAPSR